MPLRPPAGFIRPGYDPLKVPNAPTIGTATGGDAQASVAFTAPSNVGGSAISAYYAVSNPGQITSSGASSPVTVTGLTNGTSYTFTVWALNTYGPSPYSAASGSVTPTAPRGVFGGGDTGARTNVLSYITISVDGNATDFGDLTSNTDFLSSCASTTRGIFGGGATIDGVVNTVEYITIATTSNATDFGDLTVSRRALAACSSSTRGLFGGGITGGGSIQNVIDYITIASVGNAIDFGDLSSNIFNGCGSCSSTTRGLFAGGYNFSIDTAYNIIEYVTIASTGNAIDFGDLNLTQQFSNGCSSNTRGLFGGGATNSVNNVIDYVTIASTGNAIDFGDLTVRRYAAGACSNSIRGVWGGGTNSSYSPVNVIDRVTIASTGNATDFGDLTQNTQSLAACSSAHGGL